jgi:hypothetical protein
LETRPLIISHKFTYVFGTQCPRINALEATQPGWGILNSGRTLGGEICTGSDDVNVEEVDFISYHKQFGCHSVE